jgi:hypothetical protein
MTSQLIIPLLAWLHAALCGVVILFQIALILGAPWGRLTQGGGVEGALPVAGRIAAGLSAILMVAIAAVPLSVAGVGPPLPRWTAYLAMAIATLAVIANVMTRSRAERQLWAPVAACMWGLQCAILLTTFPGEHS